MTLAMACHERAVAESGPRRSRLVLVGLLVLLAFSLAAAWGRKPPKEEVVNVTMRHISTSEAMDILRKFPGLIPDYLASRTNDTAYMAGMFGFHQITAPPLERIFPTVRFYRGRHFEWRPPPSYMMAIAGNKRYMMPGEFNRLLTDNGLEVTDKNIVELAKPLAVAAIGSEQHEMTFLGATKTKLREWATDAAQLRVMIGG